MKNPLMLRSTLKKVLARIEDKNIKEIDMPRDRFHFIKLVKPSLNLHKAWAVDNDAVDEEIIKIKKELL